MTNHKNLSAALVAAQKHARAVAHDNRNANHGYNYTSTEAIIEEGRNALGAAGLALLRGSSSMIKPEPIEHVATNRRGESQAFRVPLVYRRTDVLVHEGGETMRLETEWPIIPEAGRPFDKAVAAADTASLGYLLRDLLLLPRVEKGTGLDDDDRDHGQDRPQWRTPDQERTIITLMRELRVPNEERDALARSFIGAEADMRTFDAASAIIVGLQERKAKAETQPIEPVTKPPAKSDGAKPDSAKEPDGKPPKKRAATTVLLDFKARADAATSDDGVSQAWAAISAELQALPKRGLAIAEGYARARRAEIAGAAVAPPDDALASQLNDLAKA